jgi:Na+-translocating ferredoxin:NAD+ oxidoreductase RnfG subunit
MAELTHLESKLAEVFGLAQAAQESTEKVIKLVEDEQIQATLKQMHDEAAETERRCSELAAEFEGKKTALEEKARETRSEAREMMQAYLSDGVDGLDGLEFLMMAEAGELGHVEIIRTMNEQTGHPGVQDLVDWAIPIQQRHFEATREAALTLAGQEDANEPAG